MFAGAEHQPDDVHCFRHILQIVRDNEAAEYLELNVGENWRISEGQPNPELPMQILPVTMQETVYGELHWQNSHVFIIRTAA
ncbi:nitrate/nitrite sensor protein NarQ [Escherichia coli]|uniref:Nitrate/nitrite sensor protein NarQ n=1 Tax=Escherichia coli TaxID=562 RepID=A0A376SCV7_ECOLX|nr:nitrate/nitrite sensor protein NarQ [Escherichia coli]